MGELKPIRIMLVEDDKNAQKLISKSLTSRRISNEITIAGTAEEVLEYLSKNPQGRVPRAKPLSIYAAFRKSYRLFTILTGR